MGPFSGTVTRTIHSDECTEADTLNTTTEEDSGPPGTPIVINLDIGPYVLSGPNDPVLFDLDADGSAELTTWTAQGANDAFLWLDLNGDGIANNGAELFGNHTIRADGSVAANGFDALSDYDLNADGVIDSSDSIWPQLKLWTDLNHDGITQPSEVQSLADAGVVSISLSYRTSRRQDQYGNQFNLLSSIELVRAGRTVTRPVYDITFIRLSP